MRRRLVAGNWKMNGGAAFSAAYFRDLLPRLSELSGDVDVVIAPPSVLLSEALSLVSGSSVAISAQNVSAYENGAYTGEISAEMLQELGCQYCLVGHSERRALFAETDKDVFAKVERLLAAGLKPILCVGETLAEREEGEAEKVVERQLCAVLSAFKAEALKDLIVAYEPVWAIGTGVTATPEQAQDMHAWIRECASRQSVSLAEGLVILYGGSVNAGNAEALFAQNDIDGGLVGGASLKADEFAEICSLIG